MKLLFLTTIAMVVFAVTSEAFAIISPFMGSRLQQTPITSRDNSLKMDVKVVVAEGESVEAAIMRFKRAVGKSGHLQELRHRRYFETTQEKAKRKTAQARRRARIMRARMRKFQQYQQ